jgi:hypothetical protein
MARDVDGAFLLPPAGSISLGGAVVYSGALRCRLCDGDITNRLSRIKK